MNVSLMMFLIGHFICDFTLQPKCFIERKETSIVYQLVHSGIYLLFVLFTCLCFGNILQIIFFSLGAGISHFIIDFLKIKLVKKKNTNYSQFIFFVLDQILHIAILFALSLNLPNFNNIGKVIFEGIYSNQSICKIGLSKLLLGIIIFILMLSPSSVFIKKFLALFIKSDEPTSANQDSHESESTIQAGALIGKLERVLILILGLMGQYASIALVLTAKSIARYNKITTNPDFAERYLVGTLLSLLIAILGLIILKIQQ